MRAIVLNCLPGSRFHFGKYAPDGDTALTDSDEILHSDTLFSALINTYQELTGDANPFVEYFNSGAIAISSVYYCFQQADKYTWMLPKPVVFNFMDTDEYKKIRSIKYLSKYVWEKLINPSELLTTGTEYILASDNHIALSINDLIFPDSVSPEKKAEALKMIRPFNIQTLPKVRVRDLEENKTTYQISVTEIADNKKWINDLEVHLYFLVDFKGENATAAENMFMHALNLLVLNGIGGERNTMGALESFAVVENWGIDMEEQSTSHMAAVSLVNPQSGNDLSDSYYRFLLRGGRRLGKENDLNKPGGSFLKSVRLIAEGAILKTDIKGQLVDISPGNNRKFLRNGIPLYLPVNKNWIKTHE